ncbi:hypothetical protein IT570_06425 [Candidatus Sumerlaeota bacterium]|nr:hypothetical protein [Candidatus Sumerlaeota bacterium]
MQSTQTTPPTVQELLAASSVTREFRAALEGLAAGNKSSERIRFGPGNPPVKVLRAICGLLEFEPTLAIDRVDVDGASGCSDYRGTISVNDGARKFHFVWDCAWKAKEMGWKDMFGDYDQIRAARTFGYRCFETFKEA